MDKYQIYLLDTIEKLRADAKEEPGEKEACECAAGFLVQALAKYTNLRSIQG